MEKNLIKNIGYSIIAVGTIVFVGCNTVPKKHNSICNCIENSLDDPIVDEVERPIVRLINDKELIDFYKKHFPNLEPEMSYSIYGKHSSSRLFFRLNGNIIGKTSYDSLFGIETKY